MPTYYNIKEIDITEFNRNIKFKKYNGFLAKGDSVSESQAMEIIIKTNHWSRLHLDYMVETSPMLTTLKKIYFKRLPIEERIDGFHNIDYDTNGFIKLFNLKIDIHILANRYIQNNYSVGLWINWDGTIYCDNMNIGKGTTFQILIDEMKVIKKSFPYLNNLVFQILQYNIDSTLHNYPILTIKLKDGEIYFSLDEAEFIHEIGERREKNYSTEDLKKIEMAFQTVYGIKDE